MTKIVREHINESLKEELIHELMRVNMNHTSEYKEYLENLSEEALDEMMGLYYLYDVSRKKH
jgi:hypothetical protein